MSDEKYEYEDILCQCCQGKGVIGQRRVVRLAKEDWKQYEQYEKANVVETAAIEMYLLAIIGVPIISVAIFAGCGNIGIEWLINSRFIESNSIDADNQLRILGIMWLIVTGALWLWSVRVVKDRMFRFSEIVEHMRGENKKILARYGVEEGEEYVIKETKKER